MKKYKLLPEHEARFPEWRDKYIAQAMRTEPLTSVEKAIHSALVLVLKMSRSSACSSLLPRA